MIVENIRPLQLQIQQPLNRIDGQGSSFADLLKEAGKDLLVSQKQAHQEALDLASGQTDNLHGVMVTMQKAELNLQLAIQVRNKVVEAYNEIMRIQV
ncbi:MAG: flagellar hook-basal body complex protein FliE [Limnochordia bacterium]|jgi:flagellar hook-basal body complex protein FliE|nr:flagellar hook-basal body complex protein FliE [Limnochordia bacterium]MDD2629375.1 flagellar hook-basal body complex protein FliE [Limnochordia bacterium]MDD4518661.1 flagellar hook-basal body complex protein FliE [Limnochordia bacterium]